MERLAAAFVRWEEVSVTTDKGRREMHYYLNRKDGTSDLAVVGREKGLRHMSYHYAIRDRSLLSVLPSSSLLKLRSRREVIDWLNSIVQGLPPNGSSLVVGESLNSKDTCKFETIKFFFRYLFLFIIVRMFNGRNLGHSTAEIVWLGSPWTCRKKRRHYQSFHRNGVKISVHDFVYVLAEEDKRLVAYLDDMYEDTRGNKMVVVRWFHKIDEVGIVLPQNYNDREIFFSLCLQDLSIECIDGLATVLSPQHYEKFLNEAKHTQFKPFVCHRQFDNDDIKLLWMAEDGSKVERNCSDGIGIRPKKSFGGQKMVTCASLLQHKQEYLFPCSDIRDFDERLASSKDGIDVCWRKDDSFTVCGPVKQTVMQKTLQDLTAGSQVEVLSQDSGLRGCWFRALVIKKRKDKIKVHYQDIKDAADEANNLEVAAPDPLGLRMCGRTTIRPIPPFNKGKVSVVVNAGTVVDVWWHDGWWEGIVLQKETEDKIRVYFPGEKKESVFHFSDVRQSGEWWGNGWQNIKERPDLVTSILSELEMKQIVVKTCDVELEKTATHDRGQLVNDVHKDNLSLTYEAGSHKSWTDSLVDNVHDLSKDAVLAQLKWKSSRKRIRGNSVQKKLHYDGDKKNSSRSEAVGTRGYHSFVFPKSLKVDRDNCKVIGDSPFSSSAIRALTSLVM
ncbi:agenet and bromo-adjacent homology (BAH) domain-containing protein [Actinidia rufa]|uniref:Agenet and bromo-adjacent homology (BAH) domain-containing protein n=1 Tax=Actinidia rufa TaxID=165716 RepID=A0A7J0GZ53_9ERIC|nr:agenet and bromo-adjacent homology (BAH) domain-containing protein [Actinidia rufa]